MIETIVFATPHYVTFASQKALRQLGEQVRLVLLAYKGDLLEESFTAHFDVVHRLEGSITENVRPVLDENRMLEIVRGEVERAGGDPKSLRIFCHEECHLLPAARIRETFGIPGDGVDLVATFRDKILMKQVMKRHGIRVPEHVTLDRARQSQEPAGYYQELRAQLGPKLVVKPTASSGSLEVAIIEDFDRFQLAAKEILRSPFKFEYEVDTFIDGTMYQCDSLVIDGEVKFCGALELGCTNFDFVLGQPLSVFPALPDEIRLKLEIFNQKVITAFGFKNGSTHHELFLDRTTGEPIFLEIAARVPGGLGVPFHEKNSGINLIDANLFLTAESDLLDTIRPHSHNNVVSALLPLRKGKISRLNEPDIASRFEIAWVVEPGMMVDPHSLADKAGILMLYNDDIVQLRQDFEALQHYVPVECE